MAAWQVGHGGLDVVGWTGQVGQGRLDRAGWTGQVGRGRLDVVGWMGQVGRGGMATINKCANIVSYVTTKLVHTLLLGMTNLFVNTIPHK